MSGRRALRAAVLQVGIGELPWPFLWFALAWGADCVIAERFHHYRTTEPRPSLTIYNHKTLTDAQGLATDVSHAKLYFEPIYVQASEAQVQLKRILMSSRSRQSHLISSQILLISPHHSIC